MKLKHKILYMVMWNENNIKYQYNYYDFIHSWTKIQFLVNRKIAVSINTYSINNYSISNGSKFIIFPDFVAGGFVCKQIYKNKNFKGTFSLTLKSSFAFD